MDRLFAVSLKMCKISKVFVVVVFFNAECIKKLITICDVIKQNESELKTNKLRFHFHCMSILRLDLYHTENPIKIKHTVPEIQPF